MNSWYLHDSNCVIIGNLAGKLILKLKSGNGRRFYAAMDRRYKEKGNCVIFLINKSKNPQPAQQPKRVPLAPPVLVFLKLRRFVRFVQNLRIYSTRLCNWCPPNAFAKILGFLRKFEIIWFLRRLRERRCNTRGNIIFALEGVWGQVIAQKIS